MVIRNPAFSLIVPVYNVEKVVPRCLDSIRNQSFDDFECILIDDGSTDRSGAILDDYANRDNRFHVIHSENSGVSAARNLGLSSATGDYICFIDSDDWIQPNYLREFFRGKADLVMEPFLVYEEDGREAEEKRFDLQAGEIDQTRTLALLKNGILRFPFAKRFRRTIITENKIAFDVNLNHSEDTLFLVDYLRHCKAIEKLQSCQRDYQYCYVRYSTRKTLSNYISLERLAMTCMARQKIANRFYEKNSPQNEDLFYHLTGYSYMCYIWSCYYNGKRSLLQEYELACILIQSKDVDCIIRNAPDAISVLPIHPRLKAAIISKQKRKILWACIWAKISGIIRKQHGHG